MGWIIKKDGQLALSLHRGWSAAAVALSLEWYQHHLPAFGLNQLRVLPCRHNHDVVLASA